MEHPADTAVGTPPNCRHDHSDSRDGVSLNGEVHVEPRALSLRHGESQVEYKEDGDLSLHLGNVQPVGEPCAFTGTILGGYVALALDVDGEGYDEVRVQTPTGSYESGRNAEWVLRRAIAALQTALAGVQLATTGPDTQTSVDHPAEASPRVMEGHRSWCQTTETEDSGCALITEVSDRHGRVVRIHLDDDTQDTLGPEIAFGGAELGPDQARMMATELVRLADLAEDVA